MASHSPIEPAREERVRQRTYELWEHRGNPRLP
ncbi:MAG: DUF2934 domain-containing protein [Candidatus Acidiferrales bacterium]